MLLVGIVWVRGKKKAAAAAANRKPAIVESSSVVNEIETAERENLLNYKVEGGVEVDEVVDLNEFAKIVLRLRNELLNALFVIFVFCSFLLALLLYDL